MESFAKHLTEIKLDWIQFSVSLRSFAVKVSLEKTQTKDQNTNRLVSHSMITSGRNSSVLLYSHRAPERTWEKRKTKTHAFSCAPECTSDNVKLQ